MKNVKAFFTVFAFGITLLFTSCTKSTDSVTATEKLLVSKAWSVDYFFNSQDITSQYGNARLLFSSTGNVGYQKDGQVIAGTWSKRTDNLDNELISLQFNTSDPAISKLSDEWMIVTRSNNTLQLQEVTTAGSNSLLRIKTEQ
jgi:hypothetical protein